MLMLSQAAAVGPGYARVALAVLLMGGALIAIIAMVAVRRLVFIELVACGVFFTLLGAGPLHPLWGWLWTLGS